MAKLTEFVTPTGVKGNILSPSSWVQVILGTLVLIVGFALGQHLTQKIGSKLPGSVTQIDPIIRQNTAPVATAPARETY